MESETKNIFENGAIWLRADFHLHTKADKEFSYTSNENDFCRLYVEKLKDQNINLGLISNHNKFDKSEFVAFSTRTYSRIASVLLFFMRFAPQFY